MLECLDGQNERYARCVRPHDSAASAPSMATWSGTTAAEAAGTLPDW